MINKPIPKFSLQSNEKRGHWFHFADNEGDQLTWKILTDKTQITRSSVTSAVMTSPNLRLNPPEGEDQPQFLSSEEFVYGRLHPDRSEELPPMIIFNLNDPLGKIFLLPVDENRERKHATSSEHVRNLHHTQASRGDLNSKLMEDNLMTLSPTTNSWST